MKKLFLLAAFSCLVGTSAMAQETPSRRTVEYCDVLIIDRALTDKVAISVDYGQDTKSTKDRVKKDPDGKPLLFNSPIDALHYMNEQGWELVERYTDPTLKIDNRHFLLKRKVGNQG